MSALADARRVFSLDFYGQGAASPAPPPVNTARMWYDSANDTIAVINSANANLIGTGTVGGSRVVVEIVMASYIDFYAQEGQPLNPAKNYARAYYNGPGDTFNVIDASGTAIFGSTATIEGSAVEVSEKVSIIDFPAIAAPGNPKVGFARIYYDGTSFHIIDSTGASLL
jgi:hypothetical protein